MDSRARTARGVKTAWEGKEGRKDSGGREQEDSEGGRAGAGGLRL